MVVAPHTPGRYIALDGGAAVGLTLRRWARAHDVQPRKPLRIMLIAAAVWLIGYAIAISPLIQATPGTMPLVTTPLSLDSQVVRARSPQSGALSQGEGAVLEPQGGIFG